MSDGEEGEGGSMGGEGRAGVTKIQHAYFPAQRRDLNDQHQQHLACGDVNPVC